MRTRSKTEECSICTYHRSFGISLNLVCVVSGLELENDSNKEEEEGVWGDEAVRDPFSTVFVHGIDSEESPSSTEVSLLTTSGLKINVLR